MYSAFAGLKNNCDCSTPENSVIFCLIIKKSYHANIRHQVWKYHFLPYHIFINDYKEGGKNLHQDYLLFYLQV